MGIPFKISVKSMKNTDEARSKAMRFVEFEKHAGDHTVYC